MRSFVPRYEVVFSGGVFLWGYGRYLNTETEFWGRKVMPSDDFF